MRIGVKIAGILEESAKFIVILLCETSARQTSVKWDDVLENINEMVILVLDVFIVLHALFSKKGKKKRKGYSH